MPMDILDDHGSNRAVTLMKVVQETPPVPPAPKSEDIYYFEDDEYQLRFMLNGHHWDDGSSWVTLGAAIECAKDTMKDYSLPVGEFPFVVEIVRTTYCIRRRRTGRMHDYGSFSDRYFYERIGEPKLIRKEIVWRSIAPEEECHLPLEQGEPCGGA